MKKLGRKKANGGLHLGTGRSAIHSSTGKKSKKKYHKGKAY